MKKLIITLILLFNIYILRSQPDKIYADSGSFLLHKFEQNIGKEKFLISRDDSDIIYEIDFEFVDRGTHVPLKAALTLNYSNEPRSLIIKGKTSRFSAIDDSIVIHQKTADIRVNDSTYTQTLKDINFPI